MFLSTEMQVDFREAVQEAESVLAFWKKLPSNPSPERCGGYFSASKYGVVEQALVGIVEDEEKRKKYSKFSYEKNERLFNNSGDVSSWQSRNPETDAWGGSIRAEEGVLLSFSGLPELADEAIVLVIAVGLGLLEFDTASYIVSISSNIYFEELYDFSQH
jgi:hypothetical protein